MESVQFFDNGMGAREILSIVVIGFLATTFMFGLRWVCLRFGLVRRSRARGIGAFLIPEPVNEPVVEWLFHTIGGILFAFVYGFIFDFVEPVTFAKFTSIGAVIGLVHGYFISFFVLLGFSGLRSENVVGRFTFSGPIMNIIAHVVFGGLVGLGYGFAELTGSIWRFASVLGTIELALGLLFLNFSPRGHGHHGSSGRWATANARK